MNLYSTNSPQELVSLKKAVMRGLPPDNGLYMPQALPSLPLSFWNGLRGLSFAEVGNRIAQVLLKDEIPASILEEMMLEALNFDTPIHMLEEDTGILELWHGPTLAFKDVGARFMGHLMSHFNAGEKEPLTILVATSGDTGGAVASGFFQKEGIEVIILYPKGKVSQIQEKQLTTLGHNVKAFCVEGTFDDCQALVKQAFLDADLQQAKRLTSANSINIARLIPQSFYYIHAWSQLPQGTKPVFIVPSGNFGNLTAGLMAWKMGLPVHHFIAATNANDVVPQYLASGAYVPHPSIQTYANAMDVGRPSNFVRMQALFDYKWLDMKKMISGFKYTNEEILNIIQKVLAQYTYEIDPHTATGFEAWQRWKDAYPGHTGIILGTAHPAKFQPVMKKALKREARWPETLSVLKAKTPSYTDLPNDFPTFKEFLLS